MTKRRFFFQNEADISLQKGYKKGISFIPAFSSYQHLVREDKKISDKMMSFLPKRGQLWPTESLYKGDFSFPCSVMYQHPMSEDKKCMTKRPLFFQNEANVGLQKGYIKGIFYCPVQFHISIPLVKTKFF